MYYIYTVTIDNEQYNTMQNLNNLNLSGPEKTLYRAHYNFAVATLNLTPDGAHIVAMAKITSKRILAKKVFKF